MNEACLCVSLVAMKLKKQQQTEQVQFYVQNFKVDIFEKLSFSVLLCLFVSTLLTIPVLFYN